MKVIKKFKKRKKLPMYFNKFYPIMLMIATLFMGMGYAANNFAGLDINVESTALFQSGTFVQSIDYISDVNADVEKFSMKSIGGTSVSGKAVLSLDDPNSSITYSVSIYNSTDNVYYFTGVDYMDDVTTYSNDNIIFTITNINEGDALVNKGSVTFNITFSYKDGVLPSNNELDFYLNFNFKKKYSIEYVGFNNTLTYPIEIYEGDTFSVTFTNETFDSLTVTMNDTLIDSYSYSNGVLSVSDVSGNLIITAIVDEPEVDSDPGVVDTPITDEDGEFTIIDSSTGTSVNVSDMGNIKVNGTNGSSKVINRIDVIIVYTASTGSKKQSIVVKLTHNGVVTEKQLRFDGNVTNQSVTITFDNLSIQPTDTFSVSNTIENLTNGSIQINSEEMIVYFEE